MRNYRGKTKEGEWVYGWYCGYSQIYGYCMYIKESAENVDIEGCSGLVEMFVEVLPETVGQSTGLKDKNGVDIYEGDVVKYSQYWSGDSLIDGGVDCVSYEDGWYSGGDGELESCAIQNRNIIIIGNKWDNPELLEIK